jgi:uncharacterized Fe-S cluster protein YjdI
MDEPERGTARIQSTLRDMLTMTGADVSDRPQVYRAGKVWEWRDMDGRQVDKAERHEVRQLTGRHAEVHMQGPSAVDSTPHERVYRNEKIAVTWHPERCVHSQRCVNGLPAVFRPGERPWVRVDAATADAIARTVARCPSGALTFERLDGGAQEAIPAETVVEALADGPLAVRGNLRIIGPDGTTLRQATRVTLCRCGQSSNKPFCDGTHLKIGFHG